MNALSGEYSVIMLETFSTLAPAISLYQDLGFVASGVNTGDREFGLVRMSLNLR